MCSYAPRMAAAAALDSESARVSAAAASAAAHRRSLRRMLLAAAAAAARAVEAAAAAALGSVPESVEKAGAVAATGAAVQSRLLQMQLLTQAFRAAGCAARTMQQPTR